jgi:hypothetical protein
VRIVARLALGFVAAGLVVLPTVPSSALEQGSFGTIGPKRTTFQKSFGPLAGVYPTPDNPEGQPFVGFRPTACRENTYCDTGNFEIRYPKSLEKTTFYGVSVTLDWKNARTKSNPNGNDVDLFVWPDDDPALGGSLSPTCGSPRSTKCDNLPSETVSMSEPDDTSRASTPGPLYITVVNDSGVNTGYTLTIKWFTFDLPPPPNFQPPSSAVSRQQGFSGPFDANVTPSKEASSGITGPEATPRKILVPGPDGKMHEVELPTYAAGTKLTAADTKARSPWVPAFIAGVIVLVALSTYLVIRARRQDTAT